MNKPVVIIIFLITIAILLFLFVIPKYRQYHDLQLVVLEKQAQYSGESIYYARVSDILSSLQARKEVIDKIGGALPKNIALSPLVYFLQKKGAENGVTITSISFSQLSPLSLSENSLVSAPDQIQDVLFTMNATGSYQGLKNFLFAMDNSARLFEVDAMSFSAVNSISFSKNKVPEYALKLEVKTRAY